MTTCTLCDHSADTPVTDPEVAGQFCCRGCLEAYRTLDDVETEAAHGDNRPTADTVRDEETTYLGVDGMHCVNCESFVEGLATDRAGVLDAEASYPTGLIKLTYDPAQIDRDSLDTIIDSLGYRTRQPTETADATEPVGRLLVGGFFAMMSMLWYVLFLYPAYLGIESDALLLDVSGSAGTYLIANLWLMATVVLGYTGGPILRGAYVSLRTGRPNMDLLIALAAITAYLYSVGVVLLGGVEVYFDVAIVIVVVVSLGNYYESRVRNRAAARLGELAAERADRARRLVDEEIESVPVEALSPGDEVVVRQGERVPVDGTVIDGTAAVDESLLTGESIPHTRAVGDEVIGGSVLVDGRLVLSVPAETESTIDRLVRHLWAVRSSRSGVQRLADRLAAAFVPLVIVLAGSTGIAHLTIGADPSGALLTGLAVLVVSCPCALGLATPLAVASGIDHGLSRGIVVTEGSVFEAATAETVVFDKTGTLTTGDLRVLEVRGDEDTLARAAAVEQYSSHPVAEAITIAADSTQHSVEAFENHPGRGASAVVDGVQTVVGRRELLESKALSVSSTVAERADSARKNGRIASFVGWNGQARGVIVCDDEPREGWQTVVDEMAAERRVIVLTGDDTAAAARFGDHRGVDDVFSGVPPDGKTAVIERLRKDGPVAMVGDGSNDAPALGAADVGIAIADGTELASTAADAVITSGSLETIPAVFELTASTRRRIRENLGWAFAYNGIAIPLAVLGLLNPLFAAGAMAVSSLLVVANSTRSLPSN